LGVKDTAGSNSKDLNARGNGGNRQLFLSGLRVAVSTPGAILLASAAGYGALANDAGMTLINAIFLMGVLFALPAQVVMLDSLARGGSILAAALAVGLTGVRLLPMALSLMPWLRSGPKGLRVVAMHFVAVTAWLEGMRRLPNMPPEDRLVFFLGIGTGMFLAALTGSALGYELAGSVPTNVAAALLFLTPIYFLLSLMAAATIPMDGLAIATGALIGPLLFLMMPGPDLFLTGIIGGTVSYVVAKKLPSFTAEDDE
jgi:predicted branched-subunit amino acid permease